MKFNDDALLQAAAMIVAAQIRAELFTTDMTEDDNVASAITAALHAVTHGANDWHAAVADEAEDRTIPERLKPLRAPDRPRRD